MQIDAGKFWRCLGERAISATIVTVAGKDGPSGFLGLSATHVSADPPTMVVSIDKRTSALADVLSNRHFAVNFLPGEAETTAEAFGCKTALKGADRFRVGEWGTLTTGAPILASALGAFDCEVEDTIDRGGVVIVIDRVVDAISKGTGDPLIFSAERAFLPSSEAAASPNNLGPG
ncbi:FMN reductase (NADH) NtaB [Hyphomicrobiales bacterium]|nr:FMN reductase (NADH) NtaB [Hyphomicrobiales bacterium]CAH1671484.1 FMN reductase (NADH) NtaB [Hyphomicrobiales bacterium]